MAEQEQNRSEAATPYKLQQAKRKGSVAKSMEVNAVFVMTAFLACLLMWVPGALTDQLRLSATLFGQAGALGFSADQVHAWSVATLFKVLAVVLPVMGALMVAGVLSSLVQHGAVFSVEPIKPDFNRINPATGFKRLFSKRALFDLGKNVLKLAVFLWVLWLTLKQDLPALAAFTATDVRADDERVIGMVATLLFRLVLVMVVIALLDWMFSRWDFSEKMRMSRREVKDEVKQREGDPKIKSRIRQLQNEMRNKSRAMKNLPGADVLITNPTHLGVALKYTHGQMAAPQVVAKGAGDTVERMKQVARRHGITIVENRRLARQLFRVDLEREVPQDCYADVARILIWIQEARKRKAAPVAGGAF